jgi:hypothetical protein
MPQPARFFLALTEAVVPLEDLDLDPARRAEILGEVAAFVQGQAEALPRRLALLFGLGTFAFRLYVRLVRFRSFCGLSSGERRRIFESWAYGRIGLFRSLFKLVRSTALLAFFEIPDVCDALDRRTEASPSLGDSS